MEWVVATAGALLLGVVTNLVYDLVKRGSIQLPGRFDRRSLPAPARDHDLAAEGLIPLVTWSRDRRLTPGTLVTTFDGRRDRPHVMRGAEWDASAAEFAAAGRAGRTAFISALEVDTREHDRAQKFRVSMAEGDYPECLAALRLGARAEIRAAVDAELRRGVHHFVTVAPPTMVSACVSVVSREGTVLALRRSLAVQTFPGQWTIGINETMKYRDEPGDPEDFFALVQRGLKEELGLGPADYGPITISWLGWSHPAMCWVVIGIVRSHLSAADIDESRQNCHSLYEHDATSWIPLTRRALSRVITSGSTGPDGAQPWSYLAPVVAMETWRARGQL